MKKFLLIAFILLLPASATAEISNASLTLSEIIEFALKHNPHIIQSEKALEIESLGIDTAVAGKMPKIDFNTGYMRYRYATPLTPISGSPLEGAGFPEFDRSIYDFSVSFVLPLYMGGRLDRTVEISEIKKSITQDLATLNKQELIYNLTSVYFKIAQLEKLSGAAAASVKQLEAHRDNVENFLNAGTVPKVELLKTETELAHALQDLLKIKNKLESSYELLKSLMGFDDMESNISIMPVSLEEHTYPSLDESLKKSLSERPDYLAVLKKQRLSEENIKLSRGKLLPDIYLRGSYLERSGSNFDFSENWNAGIMISIPLFDGGEIKADIEKARKESEKVYEEQRALRLSIIREVKDAYLGIETANKRIDVSEHAIETAKETLRIEILKYETGSGTSTDVIDAQTALHRAETDYHQAVFDSNIAVASLKKAIGDEGDLIKEVVE